MTCKIALWSGVYHLWQLKINVLHQGRINFEEIIGKNLIISPFYFTYIGLNLLVFLTETSRAQILSPIIPIDSQKNSEEIIIKSAKWEVKQRVKTGGFCICAEQSRVVLMGHL